MKTKNSLSHIIILDGPRGSGKSTTGEMVVKELKSLGRDARYYKKGLRSDSDEFGNMLTHILDWSKQETGYIVCDRFLATEWVMSSFHERVEGYQLLSECAIIDELLCRGKALNLVLLADNHVLETRMMERNEDGRTWDMNPGAVQVLWKLTQTLFKSVEIIKNDGTDYFDQVLLAKNIAFRAIENHEHMLMTTQEDR